MKIFEKNWLGNVELKNKLIRSAAGSGIASKEGFVTESVKRWYMQVAAGGSSMLISEMMTVWDDTNFPENYLRIDKDEYINGLKEITEIAHEYDSKMIAQIGNYGSLLHWQPNLLPVGPSEVKDAISNIVPHALDTDEVKKLITYFIEAAIRAKKANFDGVQVHAAHGFLLNKFINPYYNDRTDQYGGNTENRSRIIVEIVEGIRSSCGEEFLILFKINSDDYVDDDYGFSFEESRKVCKFLSDKGFDAIEISSGLAGGKVSPARSIKEIAYNLEHAEIIANEIDLPIILVGGIRSIDVAEDILNRTRINSIAMTRALTYSPDLVHNWEKGIREKSKCTGCNQCFTTDGQLCVFNSNEVQ